jgi:hypothetical protein
MICSRCGGKTTVIGTRSPAKPGKGAEVKKVAKIVDWYTSDFTVRLRKCLKCNDSALTVEMLLDDVHAMIEESAVGHAPTELIQKKK